MEHIHAGQLIARRLRASGIDTLFTLSGGHLFSVYDGCRREGALGGHGELVAEPAELRPALRRAFECGRPAVVNTLTDPSVAYPRRSNLA